MYVFKYDLFIYFLFQVFSLFINELLVKYLFLNTKNYPKNPGFNLYQLRHCAYILYSVITWFLTNISVSYHRFVKVNTECNKNHT